MAPPQAQAAELPDTLQQIRPSIVAIGSLLPTRSPSFRFFGSGFVVGDGNQVATNAHVVAEVFADVSERFVVAIPTPGGGRPQLRMATKEAVEFAESSAEPALHTLYEDIYAGEPFFMAPSNPANVAG